jgi:hypothetical protein
VSEDAKPVSIEIALGELRIMATRALIAWDGTVLSKSRDGLMFERMEDLRAVLDALAVKPAVSADAGPWSVRNDGRHIYSEDFEHDVKLKVDGDFATDAQRKTYSDALAAVLNRAEPVSAEDARRLDVIQAHTAGDIMICPPGNHGGSDQTWLVSFEDDRDRYGSICREYEGESARQAIDAAIAALEDKDPV